MTHDDTSTTATTATGWVGAFNTVMALRLLGAAGAFLTTVLIARYLGREFLGRLAILLAVADVVAGLTGPALDATLVRFAALRITPERDDSAPLFRQLFLVKMLLAGGLVVIGMVAAEPVLRYVLGRVGGAEVTPIAVSLAFAAGAAMTLLGFTQAYYQAHRRFGRYAWIETANALLRLCLVGMLVTLGYRELRMVLALYVAAPALVAFASFSRLPRELFPGSADSPMPAGAVFRFAGWVAAAAVFTTLAQRADLFLLSRAGVRDALIGEYFAAMTLIRIPDLALVTLFNIALPHASGVRRAAEMRAFLRRFRWPAVGGVAIALAAAPLAGPLTRGCFGADYTHTGGLFAVLFVGAMVAVGCAPAGAAIYGMGRSRVIAGFEGLKLLLIAGLGLWAAPRYGVYGVAWTVAGVRATIGVLTYAAAMREAGRLDSAGPAEGGT